MREVAWGGKLILTNEIKTDNLTISMISFRTIEHESSLFSITQLHGWLVGDKAWYTHRRGLASSEMLLELE